MSNIVTIGAICAKRPIKTWNPSDKLTGVTLSNGNLTAAATQPVGGVRATVSQSTGKRYYEVSIDSFSGASPGPHEPLIGIMTADHDLDFSSGGSGSAYGWQGSDNFGTWNNGSFTSETTGFAAGDVVAVAVDLDAGKIWWAKNNAWIDSGDPAAGSNARYSSVLGTFFPAVTVGTQEAPGGSQVTVRITSTAWTYTPPSGFAEW